MFFFVVPLRSKQTSNDWEGVCRSFNWTLGSIFNQGDPDFRVYVVVHETPRVEIPTDDRLTIIEVDFAPPSDVPGQMRDKANKVHLAGTEIRKAGGGFIMKVDADDLVSNRIVGHVKAHPAVDGWYIRTGYELLFQKNRIRKAPRFNNFCGTSTIFHNTPDELPADMSDADEPDVFKRYLIRGKHHFFVEDMSALGKTAREIPFPGAIKTIDTGDNLSQLSMWATPTGFKRTLVRAAYRPKPLDNDLRKEFAISWI